MVRYFFLRSFVLVAFCGSIKGQGLNNNFRIDDVDIKNAFDALGVEFFKFPIACKDSNIYVNYYVEEYNDTSLIYSSDNISNLHKTMPKEYLPAFLDALKIGVDTDYFRILICQKNESNYSLNFNKTGYATSVTTHYDPKKYGTLQFRAFKYTCPSLNIKVPVVVVYANNIDKTLIHCPQGAKPERIRYIYNYTLFVFLEFIKV